MKKNLPHASTVYNPNLHSFAYILRVHDFLKDKTLSNNNGVRRYNANAAKSGYLNFKV